MSVRCELPTFHSGVAMRIDRPRIFLMPTPLAFPERNRRRLPGHDPFGGAEWETETFDGEPVKLNRARCRAGIE